MRCHILRQRYESLREISLLSHVAILLYLLLFERARRRCLLIMSIATMIYVSDRRHHLQARDGLELASTSNATNAHVVV
jgi:hypothetical protein